MNYTKILEGIITLGVAIITTFVIPYIKSKIDASKLEKLKSYTKIAVQAAEMIFNETGMGVKKKEYVVNFLKSKGLKFDEETINNAIESAVLELKNEIFE